MTSDRVGAKAHLWNDLLMTEFSADDRLLLFTIGAPDSELNMLAADDPPSPEWFSSANDCVPALSDERIGAYSMSLHRPSQLRPVIYEGSGVSHASSQAHVGLAERGRGHLQNIKNESCKKSNFFYACARKFKGKVGIHLAWALSFPPDLLRKSALLFAARLVIKYVVEATRHEWLNAFTDPTPGHWWSNRGYVGAGTHSPATEGIPEMSVYTKEERTKRGSARDFAYRHSLPEEEQRAKQTAHSAAAKKRRDGWTPEERGQVNDKRGDTRRKSAILNGKAVRHMVKYEEFDAHVAREHNVVVKYAEYEPRGPYFGRSHYTPH